MYIGPWQELKLGQIIADNRRLLQETVSQQLQIIRQQQLIQHQGSQQQPEPLLHSLSPALPAARQLQLSHVAASSGPPWPAPISDAYAHGHHASDPLALPGNLLPPLTSRSARGSLRGRPASGEDVSSHESRREKRGSRSSRAVKETAAEERRQHMQRLREMYGLTSGDSRPKEAEEEKMQPEAQPHSAQPTPLQRNRVIQPLSRTAANPSPLLPQRGIRPTPAAPSSAALEADVPEREVRALPHSSSAAVSASVSSSTPQSRDSFSLTAPALSPLLPFSSSSPGLSDSSPASVRPLPALSLTVPLDSELSYLSSHGIDSQRAARYLSHGRGDSMAVHDTQVALLQSSVPLSSREEEGRAEDWADVSGIVMRPVTRAALQLPPQLTEDWTRTEREEAAASSAKAAAEREMALIQRVASLLAPAAFASSSPATHAARFAHCQSLLAQLRSSASVPASASPALLAAIDLLENYIALLHEDSAAAVTAPPAPSDDDERDDSEEESRADRHRLSRAAFRLEEALKRRESEVKSSWQDGARAVNRLREEKQGLELRIQETVTLRSRPATGSSAAGQGRRASELPSNLSSSFSSPLPLTQPASAQAVSQSPAVKLSSPVQHAAIAASSASALLPPILSSPSQSVTTVISINPRNSASLQQTAAASPSSSLSLFHRGSASGSNPPPSRRSVELSHQARGSRDHLQPIDVTRGDGDADGDGDGLSSAALNEMDDEVEKVLQFVHTAASDWH